MSPSPIRPHMTKALTGVALAELFPGASDADKVALAEKLKVHILNSFRIADKATKDWILGLVPGLEADLATRPPELVVWVRRQLGARGLEAWIRQESGRPGIETAPPKEVRDLAGRWLDGLPEAERKTLLEAGVRFLVDRATDSDRQAIQDAYQQFTVKEMTMATTYYFDPRGLPAGMDTAAFETAVVGELEKSFGLVKTGNEARVAAIVGMLLLDEQFAAGAFGFRDAIQKVWVESLGKSRRYQSPAGAPDVANAEVYGEVARIIGELPGHADSSDVEISYQEFASVSRYVLAGIKDVPLGHPSFPTQVRIGLDRFVAGAPPADSLTLPPLTGDDGSDVEIHDENIRAVAMVYAASQLERMRLFHVVDRITELFMQGMLPIGFDNSGKALDSYHWDSEDRMTEPARRMVYARVLGVAGADVSKEVQPNRELDSLFLRFLSSLAEYDRQRRINDLFDSRRRSLTLTGEQVRKSGRDLAGNASLYGWGGTHFAARRLNAHVAAAVGILKMPQIQKAYGVSNPWQVVERVAASEFGSAPNIVKYRTMAESGKAILDLVAKNAKVWGAVTDSSLFGEPAPAFQTHIPSVPGDISFADQEALMRHTQYWLAVNGIGDDQVDKMSQPSDTVYAPSIPSYGGGAAAKNGASGDAMDKIRQMVQSGSAPSLDQLKQMFPV